jgi:hypothetical protein
MSPFSLGADLFRGSTIQSGFGSSDLWSSEGPGSFRLDGERLVIEALDGGHTCFLKRELPADILVSYTCRTLPPQGQDNVNLISHCRGRRPGAWPIVELGRYKGYQESGNYIVTFVGDYNEETGGRDSSGRARLRRNPGFQLLAETFEVPCNHGQAYEIVFAVQSGRVRYYLDGRKIFDWQDPDPLPGGYFGLRTYKTALECREFSIAELGPAPGSALRPSL